LIYECILHKNKVQQITPSKINLGRGCILCAVEKNSGSTHYNWQGGISNLNLHLRSLLRSLIDDKLKEYNYECFITNINGTLEVHHLYNFNKIVQDVLNELNLEVRENVEDYTLDEIKKINKLFIEKHTDNWGIPILPEIHDLFHYFYGLKNNTPEQFYEFIKRFDKHEFDSYLNIKN
jgi:hypothetical protein